MCIIYDFLSEVDILLSKNNKEVQMGENVGFDTRFVYVISIHTLYMLGNVF